MANTFSLSPKTRWNLRRILPFGFIWLVSGFVFLISDKLAMAGSPIPEGVIDPSGNVIFFACISSFLVGLLIGILEVNVVNRLFRNKSLVQTIIYKFFLYILVFVVIIAIAYPIAASLEMGVSISDPKIWEQFRYFWVSNAALSTAIQIVFNLLLSLIYGAVSEHLGYAVLANFFTGKYHRPRQEERIFMFLDMKSSTTIAEKLGHVRYFQFLRNYYNDMADTIIQHRGEVYQYVGDEIVLTWPKSVGLENHNCIRCFFDMKQALLDKAESYDKDFGHIPAFKAGLHTGAVTTGEIGALKKEIVYTGDVLNTAARIQYLCNETGSSLVTTEKMVDQLGLKADLQEHHLGSFELRGKDNAMVLYGFNELPTVLGMQLQTAL